MAIDAACSRVEIMGDEEENVLLTHLFIPTMLLSLWLLDLLTFSVIKKK